MTQKPTQKFLIEEYCRRNGKIIPAKLKEADRAIAGGWLGSETKRRCQEIVTDGKMYRWPNEGRFAVYSFTPPIDAKIMAEKVAKWNDQFQVKKEITKQQTLI